MPNITPQEAKELQRAMLTRAFAPATTEFDYIVIGSGAGGGPLAARLAKAGRTVLVLEAGGDPQAPNQGFSGPGPVTPDDDQKYLEETVRTPGYHGAATENKEISWSFSVRHYSDTARQKLDTKYDPSRDPSQQGQKGAGGIDYPRCAAIGGCTAHHAMIIIAPNDRDWNNIAALTNDNSWGAENMQRYFTRLENCHYRTLYQGFIRRTLGWIYEAGLWLVHLINPRAVLDLNGHGTTGWQDTSFIDPDLVASIAKGDHTFRQVLAAAFKILLEEKGVFPAFKKALGMLGLVQFLDPNDRDYRRNKPQGPALIPIGTNGEERVGVRELLLGTVKERPQHLVIQTGVHATRLLFAKDEKDKVPRAIGVRVKVGPHLYAASPRAVSGQGEAAEERNYFARREVIVAGGAFNSPQLLMLSGLGDRAQLRAHGIDGLVGANHQKIAEVVHLPGVGKNLQDRYEVSVVSRLKQDFATLNGATFRPGDPNDQARLAYLDPAHQGKDRGFYTSNGGALAFMDRSGVEEDEHLEPDLFIFGASAAFRGYYWNWSKELLCDRKGGTEQSRNLWSWVILKAYTHNNSGTIALRSSSAFDVPDINFASFDEAPGVAWKKDVNALQHAVEQVRKINAFSPGLFAEEIQPGPARQNYSPEMETWVKNEAWGHHACGTCRMGSEEWQADVSRLLDQNAVLDSKLQVHGVTGLRVVDASVFPEIPGYFIVTPIFMMSEKAADTILADSQEYPEPLAALEAAAIAKRRAVAYPEGVREAAPAGKQTVGLAFSGGGIRSATFCLGVLQALARKDRLRDIDYLSSVSGGGFMAGFLGRLYTRIGQKVADKAGRVQEILRDRNSAELHWLSSTADYIAGGGIADLRQNLAIFFRNLFTVHLVIGAVLLLVFGLLRWLADHFFAPCGCMVKGFPVSPWWRVPALALAAGVLPASFGAWLAPKKGAVVTHPIFPLLAWLVLLGGAVAALPLPGAFPWALGGIGVLLLIYLWQEFARWGLPPARPPAAWAISCAAAWPMPTESSSSFSWAASGSS